MPGEARSPIRWTTYPTPDGSTESITRWDTAVTALHSPPISGAAWERSWQGRARGRTWARHAFGQSRFTTEYHGSSRWLEDTTGYATVWVRRTSGERLGMRSHDGTSNSGGLS